MASEIGDLYVILRAVTEPFKAGLKSAAAEGEAATTKIGGAFQKLSGIGVVAGGAAVAIGAMSVKWASDFETHMTRLYTAAGLSQEQLKAVHMTSSQLNDAVLKLGNTVGFTGTQMAEALYHPISAGLDLKSALEVVKYAAQEARISGASLDDTTYSLSSVMKAFNQQASDAGPTMASLNAIVGQGDMRFQDFNQSIKNWAPTAAQMGISIDSMGAGLAYLTDRGNSAEVAATRLTMGLSMMTTPSAKATVMLEGLGVASNDVHASSAAMEEAMKTAGITQNQLALDLQKPDGLYVALNHLKTSLEQAGVSGTEADSVLAKIFGGGRSDKAIMSLMQNLDGLKTKFGDIQNAANMGNFNASFEKTQQTFSAKLKDLEATLVNLGIKLGTILLPYVEKFIGWLQVGIGWLTQHKGAVLALAGAIGTTLVAAVVGLGAALIASFGWVELIVVAIMAAGAAVVYAYHHFETFRNVVNELGRYLAAAFIVAWRIAGEVVHWFATTVLPMVKSAIEAVFTWFAAHKEQFREAWEATLKAVHVVVKWFNDNVLSWIKDRVAELITWWGDHSSQISEIWHDVWNFVKTDLKLAWDAISGTLHLIMDFWDLSWGLIKDTLRFVWDAVRDIVTAGIHWVENIIAVVLDVITGKWGKAWRDLKKLVSEGWDDMMTFFGDAVSNFGDLLYDAGANLIKGLINGIKSMVSTVKNTVSDLVGGIKGFFNNSPAKEGPLAGSGGPDYMGAAFVRMYADGMDSSKHLVAAASGRLAGTAGLAGHGATVPGGSLPGLAVTGPGGGTTVVNNYITVQGALLAEQGLRDVVQKQMLRLGMNNSQTWQPFARN